MPVPISSNIKVVPKPVSQSIKFPKGLNEKIIQKLSNIKNEPDWMLKYRLEAYKHFLSMEVPTWGGDLSEINFDEITYYATAGNQTHSWDDVPEDIRETFEELGIPEHEKNFLAGVSTQYDSEVLYHNVHDKYANTGIIFESIDEGLKKYPKIFKKYFGQLVPSSDNKFAALNGAVWSGGSFVYVPKGVKLQLPIETYFRINTEGIGQFERTLIIADEGSEVHYIEGCTAPQYSTQSLHSAVVEIFALKDAKVKYTTIQNWSKNVYNLVTKRAIAEENASMMWTDVNIGSKVTMKYPAVILKGEKAHGEMLSIAMAEKDQTQDTGAKMIHLAPNTTSIIDSRSISINSGKATYRGTSKITKDAANSRASVKCDGLMLNDDSKSFAYPYNVINNSTSQLEHEATVSKVSQEQMEYLMSRGLSEEESVQMILAGYANPILDKLPIEYSVELERLIYMMTKHAQTE
jgi:Fe-S cluster assembly protein SufB